MMVFPCLFLLCAAAAPSPRVVDCPDGAASCGIYLSDVNTSALSEHDLKGLLKPVDVRGRIEEDDLRAEELRREAITDQDAKAPTVSYVYQGSPIPATVCTPLVSRARGSGDPPPAAEYRVDRIQDSVQKQADHIHEVMNCPNYLLRPPSDTSVAGLAGATAPGWMYARLAWIQMHGSHAGTWGERFAETVRRAKGYLGQASWPEAWDPALEKTEGVAANYTAALAKEIPRFPLLIHGIPPGTLYWVDGIEQRDAAVLLAADEHLLQFCEPVDVPGCADASGGHASRLVTVSFASRGVATELTIDPTMRPMPTSAEASVLTPLLADTVTGGEWAQSEPRLAALRRLIVLEDLKPESWVAIVDKKDTWVGVPDVAGWKVKPVPLSGRHRSQHRVGVGVSVAGSVVATAGITGMVMFASDWNNRLHEGDDPDRVMAELHSGYLASAGVGIAGAVLTGAGLTVWWDAPHWRGCGKDDEDWVCFRRSR